MNTTQPRERSMISLPMQRMNLLLTLFLFFPVPLLSAEYPITFTDSSGREVALENQPIRIVSLVPSVTEMLLRIGASDAVIGITHHSLLPPETAEKAIIGGFFKPDLDRVAALDPDVIFYASLQKEVTKRFSKSTQLIQLSARSIEESFEHIELLGRIFNQQDKAAEIIAEEQRQLGMIAAKVAKIPPKERQRVMRLMGRTTIMTPGDDSFQNEYIRAAGGIAPVFGQNGNIIPVSLTEWQQFNPQVLYGCGGDRQLQTLLEQPGWNEVEAVRNKRIFFFPCALTCRAATHTGYFVSWLAARIYGEQFGDPANFVQPEAVVKRTPLQLDLDYIDRAELITSSIKDFLNKTVALHFKAPMTVVSTLEGQRNGIRTVANHYFPPPSWGLGHKQGLEALRRSTQQAVELDPATTAMLFTGADMDNLALTTRNFRDMEVHALVTAGVMSNAVRMSADTGAFYEPESQAGNNKPGTINILLLTNMRLSPRAMTRAIISATEAKSAALQDLDIRSTYSAPLNPATGTGTDNILVVQGSGLSIDNSGGHTKMGELIARSVYEGVTKAVHLQNGATAERSVFQRLKERHVDLSSICRDYVGQEESRDLRNRLELLLLESRYSDFLKAIMAISDDFERGLLTDPASMDTWCLTIAGQVAGSQVTAVRPVENLPVILGKGLGALLTGASLATGKVQE